MNETTNQDFEKTVVGTTDTGERTQMASPVSNATQFAANVECPICHTPNPPSETYCIDCGFFLSTNPTEVIEGPRVESAGKLVTADGAREFLLNQGENSVGRESADALLPDSTVSGRHAKITVEGARVWVEDLGSTNGTLIDGGKITAKTELTDGCEVTFGSSRLKFEAAEVPVEVAPEIDESEAPEVVAPAPEEVDAQAAEAETTEEVEEVAEPAKTEAGKLVSKDGALSFSILEGVNTVGRRAGDNDIVIPDPYCSGCHAELTVQDGKFTVTDVGSTNGTQVNGVKLDAHAPRDLQPGDEITFGNTVCAIEVTSNG